MIRLLFVEDDLALAYGVEYALRSEGFQVISCRSLQEARKHLSAEPDLILLDIMLPDGSGYDFCQEVREKTDLPIIFMTALDEEANVVLGLDLGGDDYLTKPVKIKEMVSRIRAVLRRRQTASPKQRILTGEVEIDPLKHQVWLGGRELPLTTGEYKLLLLFVENPGRVLTREMILENLWDSQGSFVESNTLSVYVKRLRDKLESSQSPRYIRTIRGLGYQWGEEVRINGLG